MPWFYVDDDFAFHPKAIAAGDTAIGLWVRAGSYAMRYLTEGFVSHEALRQLRARPAQVNALVDAKTSPQGCGLWVPTDGGYRFHEWEERQRSRRQVDADRAGAAERKRRQRERDRDRRDAGGVSRRDSRRDTAVDNPVDNSAANVTNRLNGLGYRRVLEDFLPSDRDDSGEITAGQRVLSRRESHFPRPAPPRTNPLLTLAGRLTEVSARDLSAGLPAEMVREWQEIAGPSVDLVAEARAYLARHGDTTPRDPRGAWLGWLRAAGRRLTDPGRDPGADPGRDPHSTTSPGRDSGAPPAAGRPSCKNPACVGGWLPPDAIADPFGDRAVPCPACKPHLRIVPGAAS